LFSLVMCVGLLYAGNYTLWTSANVERQINLFCDGGFPKMTDLSRTLIQNFIDAEFRHIDRYMCRKDYCPCSQRVDPINFADRASEFADLSNVGNITAYYSECYKGLPEKEKFNDYFLTILETLEVKHNCGGICETTLFYFFRTSITGPPKQSCKAPLVSFFKRELEPIGYYGVIFAVLNGLYFLVQFNLWSTYTTEII
jgi:hypothetical protein